MLDGEAMLVDTWGPLVCSAVVARVERATAGRRGLLVRVMSDPENARYAWTERLHALVLAAIAAETGADLEELGSQAAWATYDEAWAALAHRWRGGGDTVPVPPHLETEVAMLLRALPPDVAEYVGVDTGVVPFAPLSVDGVTRVDVEGVHVAIAQDAPGVDLARPVLDRLVAMLG